MDHPLKTIDLRIERADEHLAALQVERDIFVNQEDRSVIGEFDRDSGEYVFRFTGKLPDPRVGLVVGEFGHHLRAALDNLLWQLVLLRGGCPTTETQFPVYESRERYASSLWMLRGVSADDRAAIEAVQPFQGGERAPDSYLALLWWLNNVDKHRFVHIGCAMPETFPIRVVSRDAKGASTGRFPWWPRPLRDIAEISDVRYSPFLRSDDRAELARVAFTASGPNPEMEMQGDLRLEIVLSDPQHRLTILDLSFIRELVVGIVDDFRPRFDIVGRPG